MGIKRRVNLRVVVSTTMMKEGFLTLESLLLTFLID